MDGLIQAVLNLARAGTRALHIEPVKTEALVHDIVQTLTHQLAERQAQITIGPLPELHVDHTAVVQIFGNLLSNAVKYLDPHRPGEIAVTADQRDALTTFHVQDNGRGIAEADVPRVFELFRRVGRQDVPGEGMGLTYVQTLVRRHGGDIRCQSSLGVGTTFSFTISNHLAAGDSHAG
jgi:signal transduction histidine kinase